MAEDVKTDEPKPGDNDQAGGSEPQSQPTGELIHGRFKTHEEASRAYPEAEKAMTQALQRVTELERHIQELQNVQVMQPQQAQQPTQDDNELFWSKPIEVINRIIGKSLEPLSRSYYETQKDKFRNDPDFKKYETQMDYIVNQYPNLKTQPNIVDQLFKMVKGLNFNEGEFRNKLREEIKAELNDKHTSLIEGGGTAQYPTGKTTINVELSEEEKRTAEKFYVDEGLTREQAYKKYAEAKVRAGGI